MSYCVVIDKELAVAHCPIPSGECFWKHRLTGACKYSKENEGLPPHELALLVGLPIPSQDELDSLKEAIRESVKS